MDKEFLCTLHDFKFGFNDKPGVEAALMRCPLCMEATLTATERKLEEVTEHRDLLLRAIDIKQLVQPMKRPTAGDAS